MYWKYNRGFETSARYEADSYRKDNPSHKMKCSREKLNCRLPR